ncbi:hypothetical protein [Eubacterium maltosivorans]|uniref:hypothetical protein n=1 Tax=Eubacterium maltosivorans TaxID=2041044 RepID=UPI003A922D72
MKRTLRLKRCMAFLLILTLMMGYSPAALADEAVDLTKPSAAESQQIQLQAADTIDGVADLVVTDLKEAVTLEGLENAKTGKSVHADARYISGTLTIIGVKDTDWYYQTLAGSKNQLNNLELGGAFDTAAVVSLSVDPKTPAQVDFVLKLPENAVMSESTGNLILASACNVTASDLTVSVPVETVSLALAGNGITVDDPQADKPSYTATVSIDGGKLNRRLAAGDVSFDGAFAGASVTSVTTGADKTGFTVKFTKDANPDASRARTGRLILPADTLTYTDGTTLNSDITLTMPDDYVPKTVDLTGGASGGPVINGADIGKQIANQSVTVATQVLNKIKNTGGFAGLGFLNIITDLICKIDAGAQDSELTKIQDQISQVSRQLNNSTDEIINGQRRSDILARLNALNSVAGDLKNDFDACNTSAKTALQYMSDQTTDGHLDEIRTAMSHVYSSQNNDNRYYDHMMNLGRGITGEGALLKDTDIFTAFKSLSSYNYDWSSQTLEGREAFNEAIKNYYAQGYGILLTAMQYDYDSNEAEAKAKIKAIADMQALLDAGGLNPADVESLNRLIAQYGGNVADADGTPNGGDIGMCNMRMQRTKQNMDSLTAMQAKINSLYASAVQGCKDDRQMDTDGKVFNYRVNKTYYKTLQGLKGSSCYYRNKNHDTASDCTQTQKNDHASRGDYETMMQAARIRKYSSFKEELTAAGLTQVNMTAEKTTKALSGLDAAGFYIGNGSVKQSGTLLFSRLTFKYCLAIIDMNGSYDGAHECYRYGNLWGKLSWQSKEDRPLLFLLEAK